MAFEADKFRSAKLAPRTSEVTISELKDWFDGEPVFHVRGLTGEEFYHVREAAEKRLAIKTIASKLMSGDGKAIADAIDEFYGSVPEEFARRVEVIIQGCVDPTMDRDMAMKLFKHFPTAAHVLADAILRMTGEGSVVGESKGCGGTPASVTTST